MSDTSAAPAAAPGGASSVAGSAATTSAGAGNAPGTGADGGTGADAAAAQASAQLSAKYRFLNREFNDQKHAEEILGSEIGAKRGLQRQNADLLKQLQARDAELQSLREMAVGRPGRGAVQGAPGDEGTPQTFADELAQSGELKFFNDMAADPNIGVGGALYAMAQAIEKRLDARFQQVQETFASEKQAAQGQAAVARVLTAAKEMSEQFPELKDYGANTPEDVEAVQQDILSIIQELPAQWVRDNPRDALWHAVMKYRQTNGTPIFGHPPGTSGSPSALAAQAAEQARAAQSAQPLDGSGVPRQRQSGGQESLQDRIRRENAQLRREATTPGGRKLGFLESA